MPTKCEILTEVHYMERVHPRNCRKDRVRENIFLVNAVFCVAAKNADIRMSAMFEG